MPPGLAMVPTIEFAYRLVCLWCFACSLMPSSHRSAVVWRRLEMYDGPSTLPSIVGARGHAERNMFCGLGSTSISSGYKREQAADWW